MLFKYPNPETFISFNRIRIFSGINFRWKSNFFLKALLNILLKKHSLVRRDMLEHFILIIDFILLYLLNYKG